MDRGSVEKKRAVGNIGGRTSCRVLCITARDGGAWGGTEG